MTSRGPILYRQQRLMKNGEEFTLIKFRTMVKNADAMLDKVFHLNVASGPLFKATKDPRCTRLGRLLRKSFIDELPQLINVLRGEMSLVGPVQSWPGRWPTFLAGSSSGSACPRASRDPGRSPATTSSHLSSNWLPSGCTSSVGRLDGTSPSYFRPFDSSCYG